MIHRITKILAPHPGNDVVRHAEKRGSRADTSVRPLA